MQRFRTRVFRENTESTPRITTHYSKHRFDCDRGGRTETLRGELHTIRKKMGSRRVHTPRLSLDYGLFQSCTELSWRASHVIKAILSITWFSRHWSEKVETRHCKRLTGCPSHAMILYCLQPPPIHTFLLETPMLMHGGLLGVTFCPSVSLSGIGPKFTRKVIKDQKSICIPLTINIHLSGMLGYIYKR